MASLPNSKIVSYEEWIHMPEVESREEVVNGVLHIMPPPFWKHARIVEEISRSLRRQVNEDDIFVVTTKFGLIIRKHPLTTREPDLAVFRASTLVEKDGFIHSAPQFLVEVLSPANRRKEREEKLANYAELGVPEYWVCAPDRREVEVFYLGNGNVERHTVVSEGIVRLREFPDVRVDIAQIWPE